MNQRQQALNALFAPQSVAVIGASGKPDSLGKAVFENVLFNNFAGVAYPVNPRARSVLGVKAYPSVLEIPDELDLAIVLVPVGAVLETIEQCGRKGVKAAVVISAGFREIGGEGVELEEALKRTADAHGVSLLGPNCLGLINTDPNVSLNTTFAFGMPKRGNIAFLSQSGALGVAALEYAKHHHIGISKFVSFGNKADIHENDLLGYLRDDPLTDVVLLYLEDLEDPREFAEIAREITGEADKTMPILVIKSGRTREGAQAASSHTGALAGSDEVYDAIFLQSGVLRVESLEELFHYAQAFARQPLPPGARVGIVTNSGGPGILATDAAVRHGLKLAPLSQETRAALRELLPPAGTPTNPVDMTGDPDVTRYETVVREVLADRNVDAALVIATPHQLMELSEIAERIVRAAADFRGVKPVLTCLVAVSDVGPAARVLEDAGVPNYPFPDQAARALAAMARYGSWVRRPRTGVKHFSDVDKAAVERIVAEARAAGTTFLPEPEAHRVLAAYGLPTLPARLAASETEALSTARELGYPVALKVVSPQIVHKVDVGGVRLNVADDAALVKAYADLIASVGRKNPAAQIRGVYVQRMAGKGVETILGVKRDPHFGPLLMFGLGGIYVEALKDVTFRTAPVRELGARRMVEEIRAYRIIEGFRNQPPSDLQTLVGCIQRLSQMAIDFPEIEELDINPLMVYPQGQGAGAVDARIHLKSAG